MSDKPADKFEFGGSFNVGGAPAGESSDAIRSGTEGAPAVVETAGGGDDDGDDDEEEDDDDEEEDDDDDDEEDGEQGNFMDDLPKEVLKRITAIRNMHVSIEDIDAQYILERIALEKKFLDRKQEVLELRNKIISGEEDVPDEPGTLAVVPPDGAEEPLTGIPGFWLTCLSSHPSVGELITEEDMPALEQLKDISVSYDEGFTSYSLTFHFDENDFFTNSTLTKKYIISPSLLDDKAPSLSDLEGCDIDWKEGKNLTVTEVKKKQKAKSGRNKGQTRTVIQEVPKQSFFNYFGPPLSEEEEEELEGRDDEEEPVKLTMEEDYDIGHSLRTSIIPEAILWYTGEAIGDEEDDDEFDGEDDDDDEDDGEDDDDDEDEDDEEDSPPAKGKGKGGKKGKGGGANSKLTFNPQGGFATTGGAPAGGEQPECKQN